MTTIQLKSALFSLNVLILNGMSRFFIVMQTVVMQNVVTLSDVMVSVVTPLTLTRQHSGKTLSSQSYD